MNEDTQGLLELPTYKVIEFPFRVYPKQRARTNLATGSHYTPENYRQWLKRSKDYLAEQWANLPCHLMHVDLELHGNHPGDLDNCLAGLLDAMVQAKIVVDDDMWNVPKISAEWDENGRLDPPTATIYLSNIEYFPREKPPTKAKRQYNKKRAFNRRKDPNRNTKTQ